MAAQLKNVVHFVGVAPGVSVALPHGLHTDQIVALVPDECQLSNTNFTFISADAFNVTVRNDGVAAGNCDVLCEFWISYERAFGGSVTALTPDPFVPAQGGGTNGPGILSISAGTAIASSKEIVFSNSNGISFGADGTSVITAQFNAVKTLIAHGGTTASGPSISFADANGVTFGIVGNTITASVQTVGGTATGVGISAGTEVATTGAVVFSNSNGITFGMHNSTVTATYAGAHGIAAGSQTAISGTVVFSNSNGVTFGMSGSSQITASYSQSTSPGGLAAGSQTATSGTVVFANSNSVTFGMSGSSQVTASFYQPSVQRVVGYTATGGESDFSVTFAPNVANTAYSVFAQNNGVSFLLAWDLPAGTANRAVSAFRAIPSLSLQSGDQIAFFVFNT